MQAEFAGALAVAQGVVLAGAQEQGEGVTLGAEDELDTADGQQMPAQFAVRLLSQHDTVLGERSG
ncbi:hypothetical protein ACFQ0X_11220 [Streptomyces rectiviolaceus]|uniref:hypothetical protein n=1 Tax=Streptomyces rectiviolaceus TaxID=332591 RepID=UPI00364366B9